MLLLANFMAAVAQVCNVVISLAMFLIIVRAILSWFSPDPYNPLVRILTSSTDPLLRPVQRYVPALGGIDWSPLVALLVLMFLQRFLVVSLDDYARQIKNEISNSNFSTSVYVPDWRQLRA